VISALRDVLCGSAAIFAYFGLVALLTIAFNKPTRRAASPQKHTARRANDRRA